MTTLLSKYNIYIVHSTMCTELKSNQSCNMCYTGTA